VVVLGEVYLGTCT